MGSLNSPFNRLNGQKLEALEKNIQDVYSLEFQKGFQQCFKLKDLNTAQTFFINFLQDQLICIEPLMRL